MKMEERIISREQALEQGLVQYRTEKPCKNGHDSARWTKSRVCVLCARECSKNRTDTLGKEEKAEMARKYRELNREENREYMKLYMRAYRAKRKAEGRPLP